MEASKATWVDAERDLVFAEYQVPEASDPHLQLACLYRWTQRSQLALVEIEHVLTMPFQSAMERGVHADAMTLGRFLW